MTKDQIIAMAREAGCNEEFVNMAPDWLERFARAAAKAERAACAELVYQNALACDPGSLLQVYLASNAAAIRQRGMK